MTNESELCIATATEKNVPRKIYSSEKKEKKFTLQKLLVMKF